MCAVEWASVCVPMKVESWMVSWELAFVCISVCLCTYCRDGGMGGGLCYLSFTQSLDIWLGWKPYFLYLFLWGEKKQNESLHRGVPLPPVSQRYKTAHANYWWGIKSCVVIGCAFYCDKKEQNGCFSVFLNTFCKPVGAGNVTRWTVFWNRGSWCGVGVHWEGCKQMRSGCE